jgi:hypothetical protein
MLDRNFTIVCPFCGDTDFDKVGLKRHLLMWCQEYEATPPEDEDEPEECDHA